MSEQIPIRNFPSMEAATQWAAIHQPYKAALENFQNRDLYRKLYGDAAYHNAMKCWEAANDGDMESLRFHTRKLSYSLPQHVFDYRRF